MMHPDLLSITTEAQRLKYEVTPSADQSRVVVHFVDDPNSSPMQRKTIGTVTFYPNRQPHCSVYGPPSLLTAYAQLMKEGTIDIVKAAGLTARYAEFEEAAQTRSIDQQLTHMSMRSGFTAVTAQLDLAQRDLHKK